MKLFYEKDIDKKLIDSKKIAVLGYGSQGHAHARNLKDSGMDVVVGLYEGSKSKEVAENDGLKVLSNSEAVKQSDVIMFCLPDTVQGKVYKQDVEENLSEGKTLMFCHGFSIFYEQIKPPEFVDVAMIAPKGPGHIVRRVFESGQGVPCLVAVYQDYSGKAQEIALGYGLGIGGARAGILETTFKEETETDLFGEQAVLCGGITALIKAGYETLVEAGYSPEMAYFECLHETKLITDLIQEGGIANMHYSISNTAEYGDYLSGPKVITDDTKKAMKKILENIQTGNFANEFLDDCRQSNDGSGGPFMKNNRQSTLNHPIEKVGKELRSKMKFLNSEKLVDKDKN